MSEQITKDENLMKDEQLMKNEKLMKDEQLMKNEKMMKDEQMVKNEKMMKDEQMVKNEQIIKDKQMVKNEQIMMNEQMERNRGIVMCADGYDRVDGRNAYRSRVKRMTLGWPGADAGTPQDTVGPLLKNTEPVVRLWEAAEDGQLNSTVEIPIHQVLDMTLFLCRTLQHFREAYRLPLLYDPEKPVVDRLGLQGDAMTVSACTDNPSLNEELRIFSQAIGDLGELTGERLRVLVHILDEMEMYCNGE